MDADDSQKPPANSNITEFPGYYNGDLPVGYVIENVKRREDELEDLICIGVNKDTRRLYLTYTMLDVPYLCYLLEKLKNDIISGNIEGMDNNPPNPNGRR
jgi:hypothetical protein